MGCIRRLRRGGMAVLAVLLVLGCRPAGPFSEALPDLVARVSPSVVNISTVSEPLALPSGHPAIDAEALGPQSLGSGIIWSADGDVLTNYHVIRDAREIRVRLLDRREYDARLIGFDEPSDLALLKIEAQGLPAVRLADARRIRPGQGVLAIGSPFGFDYSVTSGIISAMGRALDTEQYVPFLQTDAAINPGNSGGPLFNSRGEVVGVNSQIFSQTGGSTGVAFAIPVDIADKVARQLRESGRVRRGWLGLVVQALAREQAQALGLEKVEGALVADVLAGSPAAEAGLRVGDVILAADGEALPSSRELPPLVGRLDPGTMLRLDVLRQGRRIDLRVEIGELVAVEPPVAALTPLPSPPRSTPAPSPRPTPDPVARLGLEITALTAAERDSAQMLSGGVRVVSVVDGPALRAGIRVDDLLLQINGQTVDSPERYREVVERLTPGATVPVLLQRRGAPVFLAIDVPTRR
jgi:serine protease Do